MTPDIREKAERLAKEFIAANGPSYLEDQPWCEELASAISQALLEAHKAGREEAARLADTFPVKGMTEAEVEHAHAEMKALASAIRSLP